MSTTLDNRLTSELELLQAIYPEGQISHHNRELTYSPQDKKASLTLRLPDNYLEDALPEIILAHSGREDLREEVKRIIQSLPAGEEILDAVILGFTELVEAKLGLEHDSGATEVQDLDRQCGSVTVVIWLHHLLNTNKRKQCLSPDTSVSGVAKPGYPGVLIYAGPSDMVYGHVRELKQLNWAGFQVRLEREEEWRFRHGRGVVEVEGMKDVVDEVGERRELFLECMGMK